MHTLRRIASDTGDRVLSTPADAFRDAGRQAGLRWQPLWPVFMALGLILFVLGLALRRLSVPKLFIPFAASAGVKARRRSAPLRAPR